MHEVNGVNEQSTISPGVDVGVVVAPSEYTCELGGDSRTLAVKVK